LKRRSSTPRPPDTIFFTDRDLDGDFFRHLRASGLRAERHDDHFDPVATPDEIWLAEIGRRGWVAVSHDARIRYNPLAKMAIMEAGVRLLVVIGHATHREQAENFVESLPQIERFLRRTPGPFIARVYREGRGVELWLDQERWQKSER
jgi:PIN domain-containing protein